MQRLTASGSADFLAPSDRRWVPVDIDYAPLELRVLAHMGGPHWGKWTGTTALERGYHLHDRKLRKVYWRAKRQDRAGLGWFNWYVQRGRMTLHATPRDLRMKSWRRAL